MITIYSVGSRREFKYNKKATWEEKNEEENGSTQRTGKRNINYSYSYYPRDRERGGDKEPCKNGREAVLGCSSVSLEPHGKEDKDTGFSHVEEEEEKEAEKEKKEPIN